MIAPIARRGSQVVHVAVWAYDRPEYALFEGRGRFVPMCGQRRVDGNWQHVTGDDPRRLCKRCVDLAKEVLEHVESRTERSV